MVGDGIAFKDEDDQVIFNQHSFCELVKRLLVELVGISYEEASQRVDGSPLTAPVSDALDVAIFSHELPYYWAMFFYYGNGYWQRGIPARPEDMDSYAALEKQIMEKYNLQEPFEWNER
ncbi:MAG: hypothetical protein KH704_11490 [Clostridiales bacterium]|nr:hypothetical protein [Clostridiales bacterium]